MPPRKPSRTPATRSRNPARPPRPPRRDIQADLQALRDDVARLAQQIADIFAAKGSKAWDRARSGVDEAIADVEDRGQDAIDAVREVGDNMAAAIDESLKSRPYTTLALAVGIGFLFGATWRR